MREPAPRTSPPHSRFTWSSGGLRILARMYPDRIAVAAFWIVMVVIGLFGFLEILELVSRGAA